MNLEAVSSYLRIVLISVKELIAEYSVSSLILLPLDAISVDVS